MEDLSIDEITTLIEDKFDASISPKTIQRVDNNKLHLMFKADAAGYQKINKCVLSLKQRFDPLNCEDSDLDVLKRITGTDSRSGKSSIVEIICANSNTVESTTLAAGTYEYTSVSGEVFYLTLEEDYVLDQGESKAFYFSSENYGAFAVSAISSITVSRSDELAIDEDLEFSCTDNSSLLGNTAETNLEFRNRIMNSSDRDDDINEIEEGILALPNIIACNCVFNPLNESKVYDGITLAAKELLISITGVPSSDMAKVVALHSHYATHMIDADNVVYYENELYLGGKYPVYFRYHDYYGYTVAIEYSYNSKKIKTAQAESGLLALLVAFMSTNTHVDTVTEKDIYDALAVGEISSVTVLNVTLYVDGVEASYVSIPKTKIPKLSSTVSFTSVDTYEE